MLMRYSGIISFKLSRSISLSNVLENTEFDFQKEKSD
jgi:hypothetical protein